MGRRTAGAGRIAAVLALCVLAACAPRARTHGFAPTDAELDEIVVGLDTRETVAGIIGPPRTAGLLTDGGWYYVRSTFQERPPRAPVEEDRQIVAISFDENGVVENIERFGLDRGEVVVLSRRVTTSNVQGVGFLQQLLRNLGRIDPAQLTDTP
ncbi:MAG: outer membrane protein assembly factor BamE [Rhodobacteraceae bacterium]|jgi:outer membrane protein assembly factor BamE (lipoprotein component of BamABCDE complex)|nr:outer membrane protein assembly factor BamE [Paracoccaceae bacterium]